MVIEDMNTAEKKELLKDYLGKILSNRVAYINGNIVRASNFAYDDLFQDVKELDFGDVKIAIRPEAFSLTTIQSSIDLKIYENGEVEFYGIIPVYTNKKSLNFVSQFNNNKINKLISVLGPIVSEIDKEVALIDEEEKSLELAERNSLIKNIKKDIKSGIKFGKLTTLELKQLDRLLYKAVK